MYKRLISVIIAVILGLLEFEFGCKDFTGIISIKKTPLYVPTKSGDYDVTVCFLSVGLGDSTVFELPDGKVAVIDAGEDYSHRGYIKKYLKGLGATAIDYLIITHASFDCTNAITNLINEFKIETAFLPKISDPYSISIDYGEAVESIISSAKNVENSVIYSEITGEDYRFIFLYPSAHLYVNGEHPEIEEEAKETTINNYSAVIYFEYGEFRAIITGAEDGDANDEVAHNIVTLNCLDYGIDYENVDVLKVSANGGSSGFSQKFYEFLKPKTAVISVGKNYQALPSVKVIDGLIKANADCIIKRTDYDGTVVIGARKSID